VTALRFDSGPSETIGDDGSAELAGNDFATALRGDIDPSSMPFTGEGSAYFSGTIDSAAVIERNSRIRPIAVVDTDTRAAEGAAGDDVAVPSGWGGSMSLRNLFVRIWTALRRLQPMFPPLSCC
jgi:hypothetical protein